jgi:hypothetical protein
LVQAQRWLPVGSGQVWYCPIGRYAPASVLPSAQLQVKLLLPWQRFFLRQ